MASRALDLPANHKHASLEPAMSSCEHSSIWTPQHTHTLTTSERRVHVKCDAADGDAVAAAAVRCLCGSINMPADALGVTESGGDAVKVNAVNYTICARR